MFQIMDTFGVRLVYTNSYYKWNKMLYRRKKSQAVDKSAVDRVLSFSIP